MADYKTVGDFSLALDRAYKGLPEAIEAALKSNIPSLIASIKLRVSTTGQNADGGQFSTPYSKSQKSKRKNHGKGTLGTQVGYKGFFYQGTMWDNFKLLSGRTSPTLIQATLGFGADNLYKTNAELNEIHSKRENIKIAAANSTEATELTKKIGLSIGEYLKSAL